MAEIGNDIARAREILENGGIIAIPTETVYGLAANAYNADAVVKVFEAKKRPSFDPLIVHCSNQQEAVKFTRNWPDKLIQLAENFWPGPLTLLLEKNNLIPDLVTSGMNRVAVRVPKHPLTHQLLKSLKFPLVAPSANPFGYVSPTLASHVEDQLGNEIDYILDGGACDVGIESTIVGIDEGETVIYRLGGLDLKKIEEFGPVGLKENSSSNPRNPGTPGMLSGHYSPQKKIIVGDIQKLVNDYKPEEIGLILYTDKPIKAKHKYILSPHQNLGEAAQNLFSALRLMDQADVDTILAEYVPNEGLGLAINDRLKRASS